MGVCVPMVYVLDNMEGYKVVPLNFSLVPYPCKPHDVIVFLQNFLLFWIKSKRLWVELFSPQSDLQLITSQFHLPSPMYYRDYSKLENYAETVVFSDNHRYIDLIKTFLI